MSEGKVRYFSPVDITLMPTDHCPARCAHCGINGSPGGDSLSNDVITRIMEDAKKTGVHELSITGGEPFSNQNIYHVVEQAKRNNIPISDITTNAYFGRTKKQARKVFQKLKKSGFSVERYEFECNGMTRERHPTIRMSTGPFHWEFIQLEHVMNAIEEFRNVYGPNGALNIVYCHTKTGKSEVKKDAMDIENSLKRRKMMDKEDTTAYYKKIEENGIYEDSYVFPLGHSSLWMRSGLMAYEGRAKKMDESEFELNTIEATIEKYRKKLTIPCIGKLGRENTLFILGTGSVYPCHGFATPTIPRLEIGNINNESISEIIDRVNDDELMNFFMANDMYEIFDYVKDAMLEHDENYMQKMMYSNCDICRDILTNETVMKELEDVIRDELPNLRKKQIKRERITPGFY